MSPTRRTIVGAAAALFAARALDAHAQHAHPPAHAAPGTGPGPAASQPNFQEIEPRPAELRLLPAPAGPTPVWAYGGTVPGPELRIRAGDPLAVRLRNGLSEPTTIHWHGVRLPNAMDGVPHMTQREVSPGETFDYVFSPPDAGTYWYHPHANSAEQLERGLVGLLIVEERDPPPVEHDIPLMLKDFLLTREGRVAEGFDGPMAAMHDGRLGNVLTCNGRAEPLELSVRANARIRLRLCNGSNSRILPVRAAALAAHVIALDGQPAEVFEPQNGVVVLSPGNRADLMLDVSGAPGTRHVIEAAVGGRTQPIMVVTVSTESAIRPNPLPRPANLPPSTVPTRLDLARARRVDMVFEGGAMARPGAAPMRGGGHHHGGHDHSQHVHRGPGPAWTINGRASDGHSGRPLFQVRRNTTVVLRMVNRTAFPHGMHIHGHHLRPLDRLDDGWKPWLLDTVLLREQEEALFAFVADNPGKWMIHCHMLEHQGSGMATWFEVT